MKNSPREGKYSHSAIEIKQMHIFSKQEQIPHQEWGTFIIHTNGLLLSLINVELHDSCPFGASFFKNYLFISMVACECLPFLWNTKQREQVGDLFKTETSTEL